MRGNDGDLSLVFADRKHQFDDPIKVELPVGLQCPQFIHQQGSIRQKTIDCIAVFVEQFVHQGPLRKIQEFQYFSGSSAAVAFIRPVAEVFADFISECGKTKVIGHFANGFVMSLFHSPGQPGKKLGGSLGIDIFDVTETGDIAALQFDRSDCPVSRQVVEIRGERRVTCVGYTRRRAWCGRRRRSTATAATGGEDQHAHGHDDRFPASLSWQPVIIIPLHSFTDCLARL